MLSTLPLLIGVFPKPRGGSGAREKKSSLPGSYPGEIRLSTPWGTSGPGQCLEVVRGPKQPQDTSGSVQAASHAGDHFPDLIQADLPCSSLPCRATNEVPVREDHTYSGLETLHAPFCKPYTRYASFKMSSADPRASVRTWVSWGSGGHCHCTQQGQLPT
jgi:hypothetical protein